MALKLANTESISIEFSDPSKNDRDIYMAKLSEPLFIKLPRMSLYTNKKNSDGSYNIYYCIDLDDPECSKLIEFLYNLDSSAVEQCVKKSRKWFNGRRITKDILENKYIPPYNSNDHDVVFIKVSVRDV